MLKLAEIVIGSRLHGTDLPTSDTDMATVHLPSVKEALFYSDKVKESHGETDLKEYRLDRLVKLAMAGNPSCLDLFWAPYTAPEGLEFDVWGTVRQIRDRMVSKAAYARFAGYAKKETFDMTKDNGELGDKRRQELKRTGYVGKKAASVLRLCMSGSDLMTHGRMIFPVSNAELIRSVKRGELTLEQVQKEIAFAMAALDDAYARSKLPERISDKDRAHCEDVVAGMVRRFGA